MLLRAVSRESKETESVVLEVAIGTKLIAVVEDTGTKGGVLTKE